MPIITQRLSIGARTPVDPNVKFEEYYGPSGKNERTEYPI